MNLICFRILATLLISAMNMLKLVTDTQSGLVVPAETSNGDHHNGLNDRSALIELARVLTKLLYKIDAVSAASFEIRSNLMVGRMNSYGSGGVLLSTC